ncbi:MAG: pimelyl-ACP methyl ester esterase BioV [Helicobacteraceae bacterium]|jgi:pimeloyl-ACP methyl ester carboxylesterase|nr:pimelyl-ACP methyl ester esterase BioV [Helicobacteraceae bacterium]
MIFFSGFGFANESALFDEWIDKIEFEAAGFSLGAIGAFERALLHGERVERLTLLSPAFFQDRDDRFRRVQTLGFIKDSASYMRNFYALCGECDPKFYDRDPKRKDLEFLLNYVWQKERVAAIKNAEIRVVLGGEDRVIDADKARDFFIDCGNVEVMWIKKANHLLRRI